MGSVRIKDGVEEGPWPATAKGTASIEPHFSLNQHAGVAGAHLAVVPVAQIATDAPPSFEAAVFAGVDARMFGFTLGKETKLYSWKAL